MIWRIQNQLGDKVSLAWFLLSDVSVTESHPGLDRDIALRVSEIRGTYSEPASASLATGPARRLYHKLGIDPSKHRPSSEALLRRILLGKELYRVNTAVDAANLASLHHFRPVGLYDAEKIEPWRRAGTPGVVPDSTGEILLRMGVEGEGYAGIGKDFIRLEARPTLVDEKGPFGNPSSDSDRTKVTKGTRSLLFVLFEPPEERPDDIQSHLDLSRRILLRHVGGSLEE